MQQICKNQQEQKYFQFVFNLIKNNVPLILIIFLFEVQMTSI